MVRSFGLLNFTGRQRHDDRLLSPNAADAMLRFHRRLSAHWAYHWLAPDTLSAADIGCFRPEHSDARNSGFLFASPFGID
ncbi:hypothetical protein BD293_4127 [Roseinatronobacter monicus]|uniref:Uncharacterized protein n=1 Tax=Roseinatronobacter monicus TaxID=393481 RepID=A0A543K420_9RHOB|nr:hypothetical protein BD293_4127 [Roseinatronobacter monicus]